MQFSKLYLDKRSTVAPSAVPIKPQGSYGGRKLKHAHYPVGIQLTYIESIFGMRVAWNGWPASKFLPYKRQIRSFHLHLRSHSPLLTPVPTEPQSKFMNHWWRAPSVRLIVGVFANVRRYRESGSDLPCWPVAERVEWRTAFSLSAAPESSHFKTTRAWMLAGRISRTRRDVAPIFAVFMQGFCHVSVKA